MIVALCFSTCRMWLEVVVDCVPSGERCGDRHAMEGRDGADTQHDAIQQQQQTASEDLNSSCIDVVRQITLWW